MPKDLSDVKPQFYLTRDDDGIHLWFTATKPELVTVRPRGKRFRARFEGGKIRLPISWYGGIIKIGECKTVPIEEISAS